MKRCKFRLLKGFSCVGGGGGGGTAVIASSSFFVEEAQFNWPLAAAAAAGLCVCVPQWSQNRHRPSEVRVLVNSSFFDYIHHIHPYC